MLHLYKFPSSVNSVYLKQFTYKPKSGHSFSTYTIFPNLYCNLQIWTYLRCRRLRGLVGSALDHISLPPVFESRGGHIWMLFPLWLRFITVRGRSTHLAYHVHKSGRETFIIIFHVSSYWNKSWIKIITFFFLVWFPFWYSDRDCKMLYTWQEVLWIRWFRIPTAPSGWSSDVVIADVWLVYRARMSNLRFCQLFTITALWLCRWILKSSC